ncbi:MAG: nicotinate phosphoribosyltransferase [Desulfuromonadaceae bacterium]
MSYSPLLTDLYELTMMAGYFEHNMHEKPACFDLFFRSTPFQGGYAVFAGLEPALRYLQQLRFADEDLTYLQSLGIFQPRFLDYLREFRFRCRVTAPPEGTLVFANEPLVSVEGNLAEAQLVESALLNIINFQTLIATKAARVQHAAGSGEVVEFGLRRAQGPDGALSATRAAAIGGVGSSSNTWAGQIFGLPVKGTHAHSWVMAFADELQAFRAYAQAFPDTTILLVDTYDTLSSGLPNALTVARELRAQGHELLGIRLDSGDLAYLSRQARRLFDEAGFPQVKIVASNELDEYLIQSIREEGGKVDIYGVGTKLVTAAGEEGGALGGVYKLVSFAGEPRLKTTSDRAKATLPDRKRLLRLVDKQGRYIQDVICLADESLPADARVYDPTNASRNKRLPEEFCSQEVRMLVMAEGEIVTDLPPLEVCAQRCAAQMECLPEGILRLYNPHVYKVSLSPGLQALREKLLLRYES